MNTFQLECFLAVASSLSFAKAAEQLNVSQPTITHQIKSLEEELDVKLFRRSTRLVEITPEGQAFVSDAKSMVAIAAQAKLRFKTGDEQTIESISIGCSNYIQLEHLTDVLHRLKTESINLHPRLFVLPHDQLFHLFESERLDVIFDVRDTIDLKSNWKYKELLQCDLVCVCRNNYKMAKKESLSLAELSNENLIFYDPIHLAPDMAKWQWNLVENHNPSHIHFCESFEAAFVMAQAGFGVSILPEFYLPTKNNIAKIAIEDTPKLSYGLFYKNFPGDSIVKKFIQFSKEHFLSALKENLEQ